MKTSDSNPKTKKFNYLGVFLFIYYQWAYGLVEDRFLGMEKAAGSIPARSIACSPFPSIWLKKFNKYQKYFYYYLIKCLETRCNKIGRCLIVGTLKVSNSFTFQY